MVETNGPNHREFFGATLNSKEESDNLKFKYGSNQKVVLVQEDVQRLDTLAADATLSFGSGEADGILAVLT